MKNRAEELIELACQAHAADQRALRAANPRAFFAAQREAEMARGHASRLADDIAQRSGRLRTIMGHDPEH